MKGQAKDIDQFDQAYRNRIMDAVLKAIIDAARDPATNLALLKNYEIYDALLHLQAMILASSKQAGSTTQMREIGNQFAKRLRRLVAAYKKTYDRDGVPFDLIHTDEMQ
jgi:hypothetical protein